MSTDETSRPGQPGHDAGTAPPATDTPSAPGTVPPRPGFFESIRRMGIARSDDRWVGGVAAGVAERFGLDPLLVRGLLVLSFFLTGAGFVVYALAWALLPERRDGRIHLQEAGRGSFDVALLGAAVTLVVGFAWSDGPWSWWGASVGWVEAFFWIAVWVGVIVLVVKLVRDRRARAAGGATAPPSSTTSGAVPATQPFATQPFVPAPPAPYLTDPYRTEPYRTRPQASAEAAPSPRPRVEGPGGRTVGVVAGLILLAGALLLAAERAGVVVPPSIGAAWLGAGLVIAGAAVVVTGLGVVGVLAALVTWPFAADRTPFWAVPHEAPVISDGTVTLDTLAEAADGVHVQFGDVTVDLTQLDLSEVTAGDPVVVPVSMAAGATRILVPEDAAVEAEARVVAGTITWLVDGGSRSVPGVHGERATFASAEVDEAGGAQLRLEIDARAGDITIRENR